MIISSFDIVWHVLCPGPRLVGLGWGSLFVEGSQCYSRVEVLRLRFGSQVLVLFCFISSSRKKMSASMSALLAWESGTGLQDPPQHLGPLCRASLVPRMLLGWCHAVQPLPVWQCSEGRAAREESVGSGQSPCPVRPVSATFSLLLALHC